MTGGEKKRNHPNKLEKKGRKTFGCMATPSSSMKRVNPAGERSARGRREDSPPCPGGGEGNWKRRGENRQNSKTNRMELSPFAFLYSQKPVRRAGLSVDIGRQKEHKGMRQSRESLFSGHTRNQEPSNPRRAGPLGGRGKGLSLSDHDVAGNVGITWSKSEFHRKEMARIRQRKGKGLSSAGVMFLRGEPKRGGIEIRSRKTSRREDGRLRRKEH